ncbi:phage NrS-1 polymerase family protein [Alteromonas genovensis]|uniref:phage NrS-1 polymerase family protein n=1 Tax=Alteromonas genovensis TaxID=471225 RepID=UPI002FE12E9F
MLNNNNEINYKQDNTWDPTKAVHAEIGSQQYNRDGESENAATASVQHEQFLKIPQELRNRAQWCLAGDDKRPLQLNRTNASTIDPRTWSTFDAVYAKALEYGLGMGYVLSKLDPFTCIDLDIKTNSSDEHKNRVHKIVNEFASFTERSVSGNGYHIWLKGNVEQGRKKDGVEVYSSERFIVCTGNIEKNFPIENRQPLLASLYYQMSPEKEEAELPPDQPQVQSDDEILQKAFNSENKDKFISHWNANWDQIGHQDHSTADMSLLQMLAFYTPNNEQLTRLFLMSKLGMRDKAKRQDYLPRTIKRVRQFQVSENRSIPDHIKQFVHNLLQRFEAQQTEKANKRRERIRVYSPQELVKRPPMNWLVKGVLPESGLVCIFGAPSAGKSFLALDLLAHVSAGDYWFGRKVKERNVAYVAFEGMGGIPQRVSAFEKHYKPLNNISFVEAPTINLLDDNDRKDFVGILKERSLTNSVICLDTLAASAPGMDENSSEGMGKLIGEVTKIQQEVGGLIILVHHSGKDDKRGLRGWSGLLGALDCAIKVTKNADGGCYWEVSKSKDGKDGIGRPFQLTTVLLDHDEDGEPITSCVVAGYDTGDKVEDISEEDDKHVFGVIENQLNAGNQVSQNRLEKGDLKQLIKIPQARLRSSIKRLKNKGKISDSGNDGFKLGR